MQIATVCWGQAERDSAQRSLAATEAAHCETEERRARLEAAKNDLSLRGLDAEQLEYLRGTLVSLPARENSVGVWARLRWSVFWRATDRASR